MADMYSHARLAKQLVHELQLDVDLPSLLLGAQGPDPYCYLVVGNQKKDGSTYCSRLHDTDTQDQFLSMINYVKDHQTKEVVSYLIGYISHYALDVNIHPYIYYKVGEYKKDDPSTHQYKGLHLQFERSVDALIIQEQEQIKPHRYPFHKLVFPIKNVNPSIAKLHGHVLKDVYGYDHGEDLYKTSVRSAYFVIRHMVYDPFGLKKPALRLGDVFINQDLYMKDISMFNHIKNYDYLNKSKNTWHHPVTNEPYDKTVYDLLDEGLKYAISLVKTTLSYLDGEDHDLHQVFTNLSYNSGVDCNHVDQMQYFKAYNQE